MAKDLFSDQSQAYARYRPTYPSELFEYILQFVDDRKLAWDCATGNGQAAVMLSGYFEQVKASDISEAQLNNAEQRDNIEYSLCPAEQTFFPGNSFDLITIAQAYHWINWSRFREEAIRVGKNNSVIAVWGYGNFSTGDPDVNRLIHRFYYDIIYEYWDEERRHVENHYASVAFDFDLLPSKNFSIELNWTREQFTGYLESWSAVRNYMKARQSSPIDLIREELDYIWNNEETQPVSFPVFLKIGRIVK